MICCSYLKLVIRQPCVVDMLATKCSCKQLSVIIKYPMHKAVLLGCILLFNTSLQDCTLGQVSERLPQESKKNDALRTPCRLTGLSQSSSDSLLACLADVFTSTDLVTQCL